MVVTVDTVRRPTAITTRPQAVDILPRLLTIAATPHLAAILQRRAIQLRQRLAPIRLPPRHAPLVVVAASTAAALPAAVRAVEAVVAAPTVVVAAALTAAAVTANSRAIHT
jgi:hypothetical protein